MVTQAVINGKTVKVVPTRHNGSLGAATNCITEKELIAYRMHSTGSTYKAIATVLSLSVERVRQMVMRVERTATRFGK